MRAAAVAAVVAAGCSAGAPGPGLPVDRVIDHVRMLATTIGPRPANSEAAGRAAAYIESTLTAIGAHVERHAVGVVDVPAIDVLGLAIRPAARRDCKDDNLVARFGPDTGGALVFLAHYDSMPDAPGAVDNGVAVGVLLELATELAAHPPATPVWLAFTADEEHGLVGARKLADELGDRVEMAIALDMVGQGGPLIVNGASELIRGDELRWIAAAADAAGIDLEAPWPHRVISRWWPQAERADHGAFTLRGIRAFHLFNRGGPTGERIYLAYHTPGDRVDQVSPPSVAEVARLIRALAARPPPPPSTGDLGVWLPVPGNIVVPRWAVVIGCGLLLGIAVIGLFGIRRQLVPGPGLVAALVVWIGAAAATFGIEVLAARGYPMPWIHAPLRFELAAGLVLAGVATTLVIVIARWRPWAGPARYAAAAAVWNLLIGTVLVTLQAAELAWLWLVPAALLAWAPRLGPRLGAVVVGLAIVPTAPLVAPSLLRELYFHGFLPMGPIAVVLAIHGITCALALAHLAARVRNWGPGLTFALPVIAAAAIATGVAVMTTYQPPCRAHDLLTQRLSCEQR